MKIYLAARYSRRMELLGYAAELRAVGHTVTSRWLDGNHEAEDNAFDGGLVDGAQFALEDLRDLRRADIVIAFTEVPRSGHSRGGRHVEFGVAIAMDKHLIVVGHRENVFYCLPRVDFYKTWPEALKAVRAVTP